MQFDKNRKQTHGSALHTDGSTLDGQIALHGSYMFASENGTNLFIAVAGKKCAQTFVGIALFLKIQEQPFDRVGNVRRSAPITHRPRDGSKMAHASANTEVVGVHHFSVGLDFFAFDADVGDPVLAATVGAASDVQLDLLGES